MTMAKFTPITLLAGLLTLTAIPAHAETAEDIARKAMEDSMFSRSDAKATVELVLYENGKVERTRQVSTMMKRKDGRMWSVVVFDSPPDMAGTKLLSKEQEDGENQQFLYLPAFKKTKRIVGAQRNKSFMQTDFTYADMEGFRVTDWKWVAKGDGKYEGETCNLIEGTPKAPDKYDYAKMTLCVHKKHGVNLRTEFYDKSGGKVLKYYEVKKLKKQDDRWVAMDAIMETPSEKTKTQMKVSKLDFKANIPDSEFDRSALER